MERDARFLAGPLGAAIFVAGLIVLPPMVPGYDSIRQTVSEIGEMDSPARIPFALMLVAVAFCMAVFAFALYAACRRSAHNSASAWLTGFMAMVATCLAIFAFPNPLHNVFGLSELVGYQAPLAFALTWRGDARARPAVSFSWIMAALLWLSIAVNLTVLFRHGMVWNDIRPFYGLVQRSLFLSFFAWAAGLGLILWRKVPRS